MKGLNSYKKIILLIVISVIFFHTTLLADSIYSEESYIQNAYNSGEYLGISGNKASANIEVSLNSFGSISMTIMLILTSLLGAFFVRDELSDILD